MLRYSVKQSNWNTFHVLVNHSKNFATFVPKGIKILPMPQLSPTMTHGRIKKWHIKQGSQLESYCLLLEIVTDSLEKHAEGAKEYTMDIEIIEDMVLAQTIGEENELYKVGTPIATLCEDESLIGVAKHLKLRGINCYDSSSFDGSKIALWQGYNRSSSTGCGCS